MTAHRDFLVSLDSQQNCRDKGSSSIHLIGLGWIDRPPKLAPVTVE